MVECKQTLFTKLVISKVFIKTIYFVTTTNTLDIDTCRLHIPLFADY